MRKIYDSYKTINLLEKILPSQFRMVSDKSSNGYKFFNSLCSIEMDELRGYLDQAEHITSFENFDYGFDSDFFTVKVPEQILSGYIYGEINGLSYPISITTENVFYDGKPTRVEHDLNNSINLTGYINASGFNGLEYMRFDKKGSGYIYLNTTTDSEYAFTNNIYQTYKIGMNDLIKPVFTNISGMNNGIDQQTYDKQQRYELLHPELEETLKNKYAFQKSVSLPQNGNTNNSLRTYIIDYYEPEQYYWDAGLNIYKAIVPTKDKYIGEDGQEYYYRQALNNPNGTGVFDIVYLDLEHVPISGTLKLYDIDTLNSGALYEIQRSGTRSYIYNSGNIAAHYTYIGYEQELPASEGLDYLASGIYYKTTSWDYVYKDDGLINFNWVTNINNPITNKIKITNPLSRYVVEYTYVIDKYQTSITSTFANKYVKIYDENYTFATITTDNNSDIIENKVSIEKDGRRAITFKGNDIRPGSVINNIIFEGNLNANMSISSSTTYDVSNVFFPGYYTKILPNIKDLRDYILIYDYNNITLNPIALTISNTFIGHNLGKRIKQSNNGLIKNSYTEFYSSNLVQDRVIRIRFKSNSYNEYCTIISSNDFDKTGWQIFYQNGHFGIMDTISTISSTTTLLFNNDIIELIFVANGLKNYTLARLRYDIYYSINNSFFKLMDLTENNSNIYTSSSTIPYTLLFQNVNIDLEYVKIYNEVNVNVNNIL